MSDFVYISGLNAITTIGAYQHERDIKQTLVIDLELFCDTSVAGKSDALTDALDYDTVSRRTIEFVEASNYFLIEAVAESLAEMLFADWPIDRIKIKIEKPGAVDVARSVGIVVERERSDK